MIFNLIYITSGLLFSIWIILMVFTYLYEKIKTKNFIFSAYLYYVQKSKINFFLEWHSLKVHDWYFDALERIFKSYNFEYKKIIRSTLYLKICCFILGAILLIIARTFIKASVLDHRPHKTIFLMLSISTVVFIKFFYVLKTIIQKSKYDTIADLNNEKINQWRESNSKLDNQYLITINQTQQLYHSLNIKRNKIFITEIKKPWYFFQVNLNYSNVGQDFFSTKEEFIYFMMLLPYDFIKINFKNINFKKLINI